MIEKYVDIQWDSIIIGGGTSGIGAAKQLQKQGLNVLVIEKNDFVTTCASVGCMPSKLLLSHAKDALTIQNSYKKNIFTNITKIDGKEIFNHIRKERDRFVGFVKESAGEIQNKLIGFSNIVDKNTVSVKINEKEYFLKTKTIIISSGSSPIISKEFLPFKDKILTNENVFELKDLPKSILVIGAGVIGLELGSAFAALGVKTSIYSLDQKLFGLHDEVKESLLESMKEIYFDMIFGQTINSVKYEKEEGFIIEFSNGKISIVEKVLLSIGRIPNLETVGILNLFKNSDINIKEIIKNIDKETLDLKSLGFDNIFIAGDANSIEPLLHVASDDSIRVANSVEAYINETTNNIFARVTPISIVFSLPYQVTVVGHINEFEHFVLFDWQTQGRSRVDGKNFGKMKMFFKDKKLIGFQNIGPDAEHIAHLLAWQIQSKNNSIDQLLSMPYYHPVIEEGLRTAFRKAKEKYN